ncbi:hypothetical protein GGS20DRAFT_575022 [Poronia punctata]|nr:hypothetical protein GGS20DRAFT_575022 [Poronia punctata]
MAFYGPVPFSSPQGRKKILRRLYTKLKHNQTDDVPIPNHTILEIKFYLKTNRRCRKVFVTRGGSATEKFPAAFPQHLPNFITSQLEAQRLTNYDRQSAQLPAVLVFISGFLARNPLRDVSTPTLFFWACRRQKRTFCVFAYMTRKMDNRTYTAAELLSLRGSQGSNKAHGLLTKLKTDPDIDEVVHKEKGGANDAQARAHNKPKDGSNVSAESEIVFRGNGKKSRRIGSEVQWKYRGRSGSDVASNEPIQAPTGLEKQQSEGFQRFFKAVVSPTHVRVTAGGRIVPNTRGSASPTAKWDKESRPNDAQAHVQSTTGPEKEISYPAAPSHPAPPMFPSMIPVQHPMIYHHMGLPMPYYMQASVQHGLPYPYGFAPIGAQFADAQFLPFPHGGQRFESAGLEYKQSGGGKVDEKPTQAPVKVSPPDHFDQNRPFYVNGQMVFPPRGMGQGPMHTLAPPPYLQHGPLPPTAYAAPRMFPVIHPGSNMPVGGPNGQPSYPIVPEVPPGHQQYLPVPMPQHPLPPPAPPAFSEGVPHLSSIRPSEITKKQLKQLRASLKYFVNQLEYNRHQIDEPWVFAQGKKVQKDIQKFEQILDAQLRYENEHYPNMEPTPRHIAEGNTSFKTPSRPLSVRHAQETGSSRHGSKRSNEPASGARSAQAQPMGTGGREGPNPSRKAVATKSTMTDNTTDRSDRVGAEMVHKFSQPGATGQQKKYPGAITRHLDQQYSFKPAKDQQHSRDAASSNSSGQNCVTNDKMNHVGQQLSGSSQQSRWIAIPPTGHFLTHGNTRYTTPFDGAGKSLPYLVGALPPGADPCTYRGREYIYGRELTDAEWQARHIYWGHLPGKGIGLPKFDGKDFYPPSPQKVEDNPAYHNKPSGRPEVDFGFELKHSEVDPFRSTRDGDSIRSHESGRKLSKAIPIVAPPDVDKKPSAEPSASEGRTKERSSEDNKLGKIAHPDGVATKSPQKKSPPLSRRAVERSSAKSGHDLWQTMLKKGPASGTVLPGTITSTTASGYLPQYSGNAIASLGPTVSSNSPPRGPPNPDDKFVEVEGHRAVMEKTGENCPPSSAPSLESGAAKEVHERMLRDAGRRGVIGSDW